ncbi:MAG TPA: bifunctional riboflavin kinase/FAD synthetase [Casimicrobiaceae bacterium]|nr:bifunctional riboflavin kinase/FAD synthetase [Casimicrobiaceae bacterium]
MLVKRSLTAAASRPVALTIGNFDGVHRGHQAMLARLNEASDDLELPPAVLTFDPHPREFFTPDSAPPRLSTLRAKIDAFRAYGVDTVYIARFDQRLASLEPEAFIEQVLEVGLNARWVLVGDDFRFGRKRRGDLALLRSAARTFSVEAMSTVLVDGERVSSTAVREALARGDLRRATALLGRPYTLSGHVTHGDKRGRTLGFPTANIRLRRRPALGGIFAVRVHGASGVPLAGVASLGVRPTVASDGRALLEVFVFDFDASLYGRRITVEFLHKLRDEERFPDLDALTRRMHADVAEAREFFAAAR